MIFSLSIERFSQEVKEHDLALIMTLFLNNRFKSHLVINDNGFGISEDVNISRTDKDSVIYSRKFTPQIQDEEDIVKIKTPKIDYDKKSTDEKYQCMDDIFNGILKVERTGVPGLWFAPWDELIRWWGVQGALTDMTIRPGLIHKVMERLVNCRRKILIQTI